jgi:hypothetical protein
VGFEYDGILLILARHILLFGDLSLASSTSPSFASARARCAALPDVVGTCLRGIWQPQQEFLQIQSDASPQHTPDISQKASAKAFPLWSDAFFCDSITSAPATMPHSDFKQVSIKTVQQQLQTPRQVLPYLGP